ncbi:MAG TPA: retron Ec78 anti-phage system effector HNH endonuclease PtuB [Burkholderiaceae bacterium]|nr:retron Ec78 anti-phage system effector HNH endonuclease PtuB [Burkholderiaceae bacterium]
MRKLQRPSAPVCLKSYQYPTNTWNDVPRQCKDEIRQQLQKMQQDYCAYCEGRINRRHNDSHIEHFRRRKPNEHPHKTFEWKNLFNSCVYADSCGKHKDNKSTAKKINLDKVCKPDETDPGMLLQFLSNGYIQVKGGLPPHEKEIACNTLAIFNLNCARLVNLRKAVASHEQQEALAVHELLHDCPGDLCLLEELNANLERIENDEFFMVRRQVWQRD